MTSSHLPETVQAAVARAVAFRLNPVKWIGGDGIKEYNVSDMTDSHIQNCINLIVYDRMRRTKTNGLTQRQWVDIFEDELTARVYMKLHGGK